MGQGSGLAVHLVEFIFGVVPVFSLVRGAGLDGASAGQKMPPHGAPILREALGGSVLSSVTLGYQCVKGCGNYQDYTPRNNPALVVAEPGLRLVPYGALVAAATWCPWSLPVLVKVLPQPRHIYRCSPRCVPFLTTFAPVQYGQLTVLTTVSVNSTMTVSYLRLRRRAGGVGVAN